MNITKYIGTSCLSVALVLAAGVSCLAKNSERVTFSHNLVVNGKTLPAGDYTIQWETHSPEATVVFSQHHKVVLSTEGKLFTRDSKYRSMKFQNDSMASAGNDVLNPAAVVYNTAPDGTRSLVEIHFAGSNKVLVFNQ